MAVAILLALLTGTAALCVEYGPAPSPLFENHETLDVVLEFPMKSFLSDRLRKERKYHPAHLTLKATGQRLPVELKMSGNQRARDCAYPPMKLHFQPRDIACTPLQGVEKLYFTTLCNRGRSYEQYLLGEYLIYASFNQITELSYRVRLARVHYVDSQSDDSTTLMAFLVEHQKVMAARNGMRPVYPESVSRQRIEPQQAALVSLFQYMIGNTDYSLITGPSGSSCCHNTQLIQGADGPVFTVPYDFDHAGLINASYAVPSDKLRISSVRQRMYRGLCNLNDHLPAALDRFRMNRSNVLDLYRQQPELTDRNRHQSLKYLEGFFALLDDDLMVQKKIFGQCH